MLKTASLLSITKRHSLPALATFVSVLTAAMAYWSTIPRSYESSVRIMLDDKITSVSDLGKDLTKPSSTAAAGNPIANQAEIVRSPRVVNRALNQLSKQFPQVVSSEKLTSEDIRGKLKVAIIPATNILELNYQSQNPQLVTQVLNAIAESMVQESADAIRSNARSVRVFLEQEVPQRRTELEKIETLENQYRQTNGIVSLPEQTNTLITSLAALEDQERTLVAQLREARTRDLSLQQIIGTDNMQSSYDAVRAGQNNELKSLQTKLTDLENKLIDARSRLGDQHPELLALLEQRDATRNLYAQKLGNVLSHEQSDSSVDIASDEISQTMISKMLMGKVEQQALESKLSAIKVEKTALRNRLVELPDKQQRLAELARKREENSTSLKQLQTKLEEARIAEAQLVSNIRTMGLASPSKQVAWPNQAGVLLIAVVTGGLLSLGVVILLETLSNTIQEPRELEDLLQLPLLGQLPKLPKSAINVGYPEPFLNNNNLSEPYRALLKALEFRSSHLQKLIVVSSLLSGEGKSLVASHLGIVSAMLSRKTLIIDADLREPVQHRLFNLPQEAGIKEFVNSEQPFSSLIKSTTTKNLSVITCGEIDSCPAQLIESDAMKLLLTEAIQNYDVVIVDTPPISSCVDAATLSRYGSGLMLLTRLNCTPRDELKNLVTELKNNQIAISGIVVNGVSSNATNFYRKTVPQTNSLLRPLLNKFLPGRSSSQSNVMLKPMAKSTDIEL